MNDPEVSQEYINNIVGEVNQSHSVGQSFISRRPSLNGISLWLSSPFSDDSNQPAGEILFKLFLNSNDDKPIYATSLPLSPSWKNSQVDIHFPALVEVPGQSYYIQIESTSGSVEVHGRNEDSYPDGNAYLDGREIAADIAFRATYDYGCKAVLQDLSSWISRPGPFLLLGATLFLPGWVILDLTGLRKHYKPEERAAISVGLSLAVIPLLMLWSTVFHIRWSRTAIIWSLIFVGGLSILRFSILQLRQKTNYKIKDLLNVLIQPENRSKFLSGILLIGIISVAFFVRLAMVRDLVTPAWVDSVHHALITKMIMQKGGYPATYEPYMEFDVYNYHVGFHSNLAVFTWLSELEIHDSMLVYGQALNALAALSVYLLATTITHKPLVGTFAALITAFFTPMPAYYTSWGRYTQLAGLLILPSILALANLALHQSQNYSQHKRVKRYSILLVIISISGLFLVHYRVIAFVVLLLFAMFITELILQNNCPRKTLILQWFTTGIVCVIGSIILVYPWLFPALGQIFLPKLSQTTSTQVVLFGDFSWRFLTTAFGKQALILASLGLVWAIFKNFRLAMIILLWVIQLLFFANLDALKLPGGGFITGTSVVIMLFIPISILCGYFLDQLIFSWRSVLPIQSITVTRYVFWSFVLALTVLVSMLSTRQLLPILNPITILSRQADLVAIEWISQHIPGNTAFLLNSFSWGFGLYAGSDGGYWITPITGARTMPPPALYGLGKPDTVNNINSINQIAFNSESTPQELWEMMIDKEIDYVYIGRRGGPLSTTSLLKSELFDLIYYSNGAWIFKPQVVP